MSGVTHMETDVLFCSKLMITNGKIVVGVLYETILLKSLILSNILLKKDYLSNYIVTKYV